MNLCRCEKGHFYDKDKYSSCPHCSSGNDFVETPPVLPWDLPTIPHIQPEETNDKDIQSKESNGKSVASFVLGIIGMMAWCLPILGFPVGVVGLTLGIHEKNSSSKMMTLAGIILNILCLALCVFNTLLGVYLFMISGLYVR